MFFLDKSEQAYSCQI